MKKEPLSIITVKTLLAVVIFTGLGTIIIGGGWLVGKQDVQVKPTISIESFKDCDKFKDTEKNDCYLDLAKENKDESFCEKIDTIEHRSMCYTDLAILKNNPGLCDKAITSSCVEYFGLKKPVGWNFYISNPLFLSEKYQINYNYKWDYSENRIDGSKRLGKLRTVFKDEHSNTIVEIIAGDLLSVYLNDKLYENKGKISYGSLSYEFLKYEEIKTGNVIYIFDTKENKLADSEQEKYNEVIVFKISMEKESDFKKMLSTFEYLGNDKTNFDGWQIYRNESFEYTIAYPRRWTLKYAEESAIHFNDSDSEQIFDIYIEERNNQTVQQWIQKDQNRYKKIKSIMVNGSEGLLAEDKYTMGSDYYIVIFPHKNYMVKAGCASPFSDLLEKVISSFKPMLEIEKGAAPEKVVENFYNWYIDNINKNGKERLSYKSNRYISNELIQSIDEIIASFGDGPGFDPILCAQDVPNRVIANKVKISGENAEVMLERKWNEYSWGETKIDLKLVHGEWKINKIVCLWK